MGQPGKTSQISNPVNGQNQDEDGGDPNQLMQLHGHPFTE
jgi:hypothetical protein